MKGIKYNVFLGLINYIYTDHIKVSSHVAKDLLTIAQKYGLERLVQLCKRTIEKDQYLVPSSLEEVSQINNTLQYSSFSDDLETVINNTDSSDLTFRSSTDVNSTKIAVHKCILRSRSNYFERLFGGEFKEKDMFEHTVPVSIDTLNVIFQYLYAGSALVTPENAIDILEAAQYFMLDDLFNIVEAYIIQTVDVENCMYSYIIILIY